MDSNLNNIVILEIADSNDNLLHKQECPTAMIEKLAMSWLNNTRSYKFRITRLDGSKLGSL
jgi:hypothetical protein